MEAFVHMEAEVAIEIIIEDKTTSGQILLMQKLGEKDKGIIYSMIDIMLTKRRVRFFSEECCCTIKQKP